MDERWRWRVGRGGCASKAARNRECVRGRGVARDDVPLCIRIRK